MTAVAHHPLARRPRPVAPLRHAAPALYLTGAAGSRRRTCSRRRRALAALAAALLGAGIAAGGVLGEGPLTLPGPAPAAAPAAVPVARASYVVRPGDTLWHIARSLQPEGDVRPLVQRLSAARRGAPLQVGERVVLAAR